MMSSRKRRNFFISIMVNGVVVEDVNNVCEAMFTHFYNHFSDFCETKCIFFFFSI